MCIVHTYLLQTHGFVHFKYIIYKEVYCIVAKKDWFIKSIPVDTCEIIKRRAKLNGITIGEYLGLLVDSPAPLPSGTWTIRNINGGDKDILIKNARRRGMTLGEYIGHLAQKDEDDSKAANDLRDMTAILKRYGKI